MRKESGKGEKDVFIRNLGPDTTFRQAPGFLLEVRDLWINYGDVAAVKGVSLTMSAGSIVTLIGGNGAGKTTILKCISGLIKPTRGEIWLNGELVTGKPAHEVTVMGIGAVPEGRRLFGSLTVHENLLIGAYRRLDATAVAQDLDTIYEQFPTLEQRSAQRAGTLSGGEQQMVAIGRALMAKPQLLLMDEPSMGLSPILVQEIYKMVRHLNVQRGLAILLVEQNARLALRTATEGHIMQAGTIVRNGNCQDLMNDDELQRAYLGD